MNSEQPQETTQVLDTLHSSGKGFGRFVIRISKWGNRPPILEKRQIIQDENGDERDGRCRGFLAQEVEKIVNMWPRIQNVFLLHDEQYSPRRDETKKAD